MSQSRVADLFAPTSSLKGKAKGPKTGDFYRTGHLIRPDFNVMVATQCNSVV